MIEPGSAGMSEVVEGQFLSEVVNPLVQHEFIRATVKVPCDFRQRFAILACEDQRRRVAGADLPQHIQQLVMERDVSVWAGLGVLESIVGGIAPVSSAPHLWLRRDIWLHENAGIHVQRFGNDLSAFFADGPLSVLHFGDMPLRE